MRSCVFRILPVEALDFLLGFLVPIFVVRSDLRFVFFEEFLHGSAKISIVRIERMLGDYLFQIKIVDRFERSEFARKERVHVLYRFFWFCHVRCRYGTYAQGVSFGKDVDITEPEKGRDKIRVSGLDRFDFVGFERLHLGVHPVLVDRIELTGHADQEIHFQVYHPGHERFDQQELSYDTDDIGHRVESSREVRDEYDMVYIKYYDDDEEEKIRLQLVK